MKKFDSMGSTICICISSANYTRTQKYSIESDCRIMHWQHSTFSSRQCTVLTVSSYVTSENSTLLFSSNSYKKVQLKKIRNE